MKAIGRTQTVRVGIVGGGLMGREAAAAIARWPALLDHPVRPIVTAVCDVNNGALDWFRQLPSVELLTGDHRELLESDVDVVYVAVRHDLHEQIYSDVISAGIDLFAEKPFGIDLAAAERIVSLIDAGDGVFVRCSSEFPFFPGAQAVIELAQSGAFGRVVEASSGFSHSSDLDPGKPLNWKRENWYCGEAGVMNDLGLHVLHVPLRLGFWPHSVFAILQDLVPFRPLPDGTPGRCDTIENATLLCALAGPDGMVPLSVTMKRIDPGQMNTWTLKVIGMSGGAQFSTRYPKTVRRMRIDGKDQVWQEVEMGSQGVFPTITGAIFESGFSDAIQQMWAAYLAERAGVLDGRFGCATPAEALDAHRVVAAALELHRQTARDPAGPSIEVNGDVPSVLVAGHVCLDVIPGLPSRPDTMPGSLSEIGPVALVPGGCVANTGSTLAALGESVRIAADVGDDELGRVLRSRLADLRLDPSGISTVADLGTSYSIVLEPADSDRSIWHHVGANAHFDGADLDLADIALLHVGYAPLLPALLDAEGTALSHLLGGARQHGAATSLDLAVVAQGSRSHSFDWRGFLRRTLPYVDVLSPSADDLGSMLGPAAVGSPAQLRALASTLVDWGAAVVVITAGDEGLVLQTAPQDRLELAGDVLSRHALEWSNASLWAAAPKVTVKSTRGAGDAASAGLLHGLLRGQDPALAANTAVGVAAQWVSGTLRAPERPTSSG